MDRLTALIDADNFYVSCERLFNPALRHRPVVVLSNNDGCVVARSQEVKDMGVGMGTPFFQIRRLAAERNIAVFSSNYELYGNISARLMRILGGFSARVEVYSIDEAFIELETADVGATCVRIIDTCRDWLGVPVKIGVARTKTLAKVAAELVKRTGALPRCRVLLKPGETAAALSRIELEDIWGVGSRTAAKLKQRKIASPARLATLPDAYVRKHFGVVLARTVAELNAVVCFDFETTPAPQKNLCCSRSFGQCATEYEDLREAVSTYASEAAAKLRRRKLKASSLSVFILTDRFRRAAQQYVNSACLPLEPASGDTLVLVRQARRALDLIFRPGYAYKKAGVILNELVPETREQADFFLNTDSRNAALSQALDSINAKYGADTVAVASCGFGRPRRWRMSRRHQSPRFTTRWGDLPEVG